jgi:hypothetical protein
MISILRRTSILSITLLVALLGSALAPAQSGGLDKHARKVQEKLATYRTGSYLHLVLSDAPDAWGALGTLSDTSFTFTSAESNTAVNYRYGEVDRIKTDQQPIGRGAQRPRFRHLIPVVIVAAAAGAGAAVYMAQR